MTPDADFGAGDARKPQRLEDILKALQSWPPHTMPPVGPNLGPNFVYGAPSGGSPTFSETAPEPAVTITGYALGWRVWSVVSTVKGVRLMSFGDTIWPPRTPLRAECRTLSAQTRQHVPPEPGCSCGIYAMKRPLLHGATFVPGLTVFPGVSFVPAATFVRSFMGLEMHPVVGWVTGKVALWGRTLESDFGFRAQYAYPQVLWSGALAKDKRVALGNAYGVEVYEIDDTVVQAMADADWDWLITQEP